MCVDVSHLVFETSRDANDEIVDYCLHRSQGGYILPGAMMELNIHGVLVGMGEANSQMSHILDQFP